MDTRIHEAPKIYRVKKKRFRFKSLLILFLAFILLYLSLYLLIIPERPDRSFFQGKNAFVIADGGGSKLAPENTLIAFEKAKSLGVDMIKTKVYLTKDRQLVLIADPELKLTTNGEGKITDMTLNEIKNLDAAYRFQDIGGRYIFRNQGVTVPTLGEAFEHFPDMRFIIELTDALDEEVDGLIEELVWQEIVKYNMDEKVLVTSPSEKILREFKQLASEKVAVGASKQETSKFILYHKLFIHRLYRSDVDAYLFHVGPNVFNVKDQRLIEGAKLRNTYIFYETVDDEETMRTLLRKNAQGIITKRPDLLIRVLNDLEGYDGKDRLAHSLHGFGR